MISLGAAAFWIALAAVVIASGWFKSRTEEQKHETLRRLIDKTGTVDEARIGELFNAQSRPSGWTNPELWRMPPSIPGAQFKALLVMGTLVLSIAAGLALLFAILASGGVSKPEDTTIGLGISALVAAVGVGLFASALFVERPPKKRDELSGPAP